MKSEEYYRVVSETPPEGFTVKELYKVVGETPSEGFTAEEWNKIIEGPEKVDSLEYLDRPPKVDGTQKHEEVKKAVKEYFSKSFSNSSFTNRPEQPIDIGTTDGKVDVGLYAMETGKYVALSEVKRGNDDANYGRRQLFAYLCATNTRFGIFANNLKADDWIFYKNLRHFRFRRIARSQFEEEVKKNNYELPDKPLIPEDSKEILDQIVHAMNFSQLQTPDIQTSVDTYFSPILEQQEWGCKQENNKEVRINSKTVKNADFVLHGRDGSYIAIVEFRNSESSRKSILDSLLCATDTRFGIRAGSNPNKWKFYERLGSELPREIEHSEFTQMVVTQAKEAACPVFKGDKISKEDWNKYNKTWNTLKSEKVWRVVKTYHPKCPLKIDEYISDDDYKRAQESYPRCSVKKDDILTKAELDEQHKTWPKLTTEKVWRVTGVFHSDCSFNVGQYISQVEYNQAQVDYPGCPVKKGDILTKAEWEQFPTEVWSDVHIERVSWISEAEHQQIQEERDKYRSMIRRWQLIAAGTVFLLAFIWLGIFSMHQNLMEDADTRNAVLAKQLIGKQSEVHQKESKIQDINSELQTLRNEKTALNHQNSLLRNELKNNAFLISNIPNQLRILREQLDEQKDDNQRLQNQLGEKDAAVQQLRKDKAVALSENQRLQSQLIKHRQGTMNQNATVKQLESKNLKLQNQNQDLVRQNQNLQDKNEALQKRLDDTKQNSSNQAKKLPSDSEDEPQPTIPPQMENLIPEPPKKIQEDRTVRHVDISRNRQGCFAFEGGDYDKAIRQFEQVIKADSELEIAHYNLGCTFLEMKDYPKAISAFDEAVAINHNFKEAHYNLSLVYFRNGAREQAKSSAKRALGIDKNYQRARSLLAFIEKAQR